MREKEIAGERVWNSSVGTFHLEICTDHVNRKTAAAFTAYFSKPKQGSCSALHAPIKNKNTPIDSLPIFMGYLSDLLDDDCMEEDDANYEADHISVKHQ
jgi:hypothetical protein